MNEATDDSELTNGTRVKHSQYGSGTFRTLNTSGNSNVVVVFDSRGRRIVDGRDLEPLNELLRDTSVEVGQEREDEDGLVHGGVKIDLEFDKGVDADVDVGPDGNIIVQYWRHEQCIVCDEDIPKDREKTCSTSCTLELRNGRPEDE